jgi:hypothetical protein
MSHLNQRLMRTVDVTVEGESPLKDPHFSLAISEAFAVDWRRASPQEDGTRQC